MSTALTKQNTQVTQLDPKIMEKLILKGDLGGLDSNQKVIYYKAYCERLGLDPATQPFKIISAQGKQILYCDRSGTQQLNKAHNVSPAIVSRTSDGDTYEVIARASTPDGRSTESIGAVSIGNLKGEAKANAKMKAETKAKRRATLDLVGLGIPDETEIETIPNTKKIDVVTIPVDETKPNPEITEDAKVVDKKKVTEEDLKLVFGDLKDEHAAFINKVDGFKTSVALSKAAQKLVDAHSHLGVEFVKKVITEKHAMLKEAASGTTSK